MPPPSQQLIIKSNINTMSKKINKYALKAQRKTMGGISTTAKPQQVKGNIKKTVIITGKDIVIGGLGGALVGAVVGRSSLLLGILVTAGGHYFGSSSASMFGVGMMASGGYQSVSSGLSGVEKEGIEGVKERFSNFTEVFKRQFYLDKLPIKKNRQTETDDGTNGMGRVQYFKHHNSDDLNGRSDLDFSEANRIEEQLENMASKFANKSGMTVDLSNTTDMTGLDGDVSEKLL
jgi:hypothetical protein